LVFFNLFEGRERAFFLCVGSVVFFTRWRFFFPFRSRAVPFFPSPPKHPKQTTTDAYQSGELQETVERVMAA
jgi:hypothetical protein